MGAQSSGGEHLDTSVKIRSGWAIKISLQDVQVLLIEGAPGRVQPGCDGERWGELCDAEPRND